MSAGATQQAVLGPRPRLTAVGAARRWRLLALGLLLIASGWLLLEWSIRSTAPPDLHIATSPVVLDRHDQLLRAFAVADGRWRLPVTASAVDAKFLQLLLAFEDRRFTAHQGVDGRALLRALAQALRHQRIVSGGSTLTMQVVRLRGGCATRSLTGKWQQALAALALERVADKPAILNAYLNLAPYGGNLEGVRAGALAWLGKEPRHLTVAEAALLVALPQAPTARRPDLHPEAARRGRDRVLARALALGVIDAETAAAARAEPLPQRRRPFPLLAAHLAERVVRAAPGRPVHRLTLDANRQAQLEALVAEHARLVGDGVSAALLVVAHQSGEIVAAVGSAGALDPHRAGFVDMTRAVRSPGSTLKPLIYGLAFEQGLAHPESLIEDRPSAFGGYAPENFDRAWAGTVTVREALQLSLNIPAMTVLEQVGPVSLLARLRRAGAHPMLPPGAPPGLAIGLGGVGVTLRELVSLYAAIARGGQPVTLIEERAQPGPPPSPYPVLERRAAWQIGAILSNAGRGGERLAIKTGTSYGYRDAWAIGYDGRHVVGVWIGRPDAAAVPGLTGAARAVPLLRDAFARLGPAQPLPAAPPGVLVASSAQLPPTLARVQPRAAGLRGGAPLQISWPPPGARIERGLGQGGQVSDGLTLKVRNGQPPFNWFADGALIAQEPFARQTRWQPSGPGYTTIAVVDARGAASRVMVLIE